ncbi:RagB/SusD family nutrient uptake outer membrane protein [Pararcticibacter amylolyticus]|uniref:RagB/SusD family nutrient uptake outer membrane protein n=1 Tax=Pararcticibacter amylolyticus TaxID=2173175 RepID=A0A2U2PC65_9SPHI|nr:RagB/SusD family nutrient uptake outer membrane protein [Pararcticibacter amylolyticus]PWG78987.1 RagB/SusD family nutrient uptake outer membrane protein [Pararcticibacter amylolyticus]
MKSKYKFLAAFFSLVVILSSCEKELNQTPVSDATTSTFYKIPSDFTQGVYAVYSSLRAYPNRQLNLSETRSDNLWAASTEGVRDWDPINNFQTTISANTFVDEAWSANYSGITYANTLLDQLARNGSAVLHDETLQKNLEAEARFLRAFFYLDLVRWFGKVPVVDRLISAAEAAKLDRAPASQVYDLIISDLQYAIQNLPVKGLQVGRVNKAAARALLALVYMTKSGATYGIEGPGTGSNEWDKALALLNEVTGDSSYGFLDSYSSIYAYNNENNKEVIFDIQYSTGASPIVGGWFPVMLAANNWFLSLGLISQGTLEVRPLSKDLLASYGAGDLRDAFSVQHGYVYQGTQDDRAFWKKYIDVSKAPTNREDWPINYIVISYTDALLLKAECLLQLKQDQAEVDRIVNKIRKRAGLSDLSNVNLSQLMEERRKEFGGEGKRWHDLVRSGLAESVMKAWIAKEDVNKVIKNFSVNSLIYPIPLSELEAKSGVYTQNSGYN